MIGKIMSEAAHSIIGMFSAKPNSMEQTASNFDFGSLLRSTEEQPHSAIGAMEFDVPESGNSDLDEANSAVAQNWDMETGLPSINQNLSFITWLQTPSFDNIEQQVETDETTAVGQTDLVRDRTAIGGLISDPKAIDKLFGPGSLHDVKGSTFKTDVAPLNQEPTFGKIEQRVETDERPAVGQTGLVRDRTAIGGLISDPKAIDKLFGPGSLHDVKGSAFKTDVAPLNQEPTFGKTDMLDGRPGSEQPSTARSVHDFATRDQKALSGLKIADFVADHPLPSPPIALRSQEKAPDGAIPSVFERALSKGLEANPPAKAFELPVEQPPLTTLATSPAVREAAQTAASFDLSAPRVAERLAAEIADLSVSGETKKFEINPRNLGRMEIILTMRGSTEVIEIQTENRAAKDIINQHSQVLQDMLKSQGREDLAFRVDVKDNMLAPSRADSGSLSQQENRDAREQQSRPTRSGRISPTFDGPPDRDAASDNSRYA